MQFGGKGVEYGEFVGGRQTIDQEYRTLTDREHTAMIGSSLVEILPLGFRNTKISWLSGSLR